MRQGLIALCCLWIDGIADKVNLYIDGASVSVQVCEQWSILYETLTVFMVARTAGSIGRGGWPKGEYGEL